MSESRRQQFKIGRSPFKSDCHWRLPRSSRGPCRNWIGCTRPILEFSPTRWEKKLVSPPNARSCWRPPYNCSTRTRADGTEAAIEIVLQKQQGDKSFTLGKADVGKDQIKKSTKAVQTKDIFEFAVALAQEFKEDGSDVARSRCQAMEELAAMHALVRKQEISADDLMAWRAHATMFAFHYASCDFTFYPEFHYLMHIPEQVEQSGVLRSFWVYAEESNNRRLKTLFTVNSKGANIHQQIQLRLQWLRALLASE